MSRQFGKRIDHLAADGPHDVLVKRFGFMMLAKLGKGPQNRHILDSAISGKETAEFLCLAAQPVGSFCDKRRIDKSNRFRFERKIWRTPGLQPADELSIRRSEMRASTLQNVSFHNP